MSLRRDVHSAFDQITPSTAGLSERVVQTVLAEGATRRRKEKMVFRLRAPLSLVAVFLIIAVVVAVFIGGRLITDWNALHNTSPAGSNRADLAQLEARPLNLPVYHSRSECTVGPLNADGAYGSGPMYLFGGLGPRTARATYYNIVMYTDVQIAGPILVRAHDVVRNINMVFVGRFAAGPVVGTDVLSGTRVEQHTEIVLNESQTSPVVDNPPAKPHAFVWGFTVGVPQDSTGSTGWQVDGGRFSEVFFDC
ncbi:MAG TPA: hypothetical protein VJP81_03105 [Candidatus Dormibacteraeota bacterium]|nr:hypothetical protein [Candidatus Dormibacteraeota bacterium]